MPKGAECGGTGGGACLLRALNGRAVGFGDVPEDLARLDIMSVCLFPGCGQTIQKGPVESPTPCELRMLMQRRRTLTFVQMKELDASLLISVHFDDGHCGA